ncbi:hypothetical protein FWK35_00001181 [Aphis craccivora]|uniref:Uncharacterized protein n=1 Tax=Aphis craccivora TaxID=307492 RepID=A0A6G0ZEV9_APHCR|nr:hypothetical protein FWK35_00001181 [Aphis craccivora]
MNIFGVLQRSNKRTFPSNFQNSREKQRKSDGKTEIFTQNQFSTKSIFFCGGNSKTNHCKYLKQLNSSVYISVSLIL